MNFLLGISVIFTMVLPVQNAASDNEPRILGGHLTLVEVVTPPGNQPPGAELTYTTNYANVGTAPVTGLVILRPVPAFTQFKVGSATTGVPPATVARLRPEYSSDGGKTWVYVPKSTAGGAPPDFDGNVTNVRFVIEDSLPPGAASTVGVSFTVRIAAE